MGSKHNCQFPKENILLKAFQRKSTIPEILIMAGQAQDEHTGMTGNLQAMQIFALLDQNNCSNIESTFLFE